MADVLLTSQLKGERLELAASGSWTAAHAHELETLVDRVAGETARAKKISIDMGGVREFDTFGAWLLERLTRAWSSAGQKAVIVGLPKHDRGLLEEMHGVNREPPPTPARENRIISALASVGGVGAGLGRDLMLFADMLGAVGMAAVRVLTRPRDFRFTSTVNQLDRVAWQAVPIILLITFLIGGIISQQGIFHFRKFGAELYAVDLVGILVLREIGVLIVAIMVAGRSGSSYTAELGSMKMREEIDALRTMGFDPVEVLILPRILVLIIALPVLTFLGCMAALYGGGLVAWLYGGMSPDIYIARLTEAISLTHFKVGMLKAPFMGLVIGIVACAEGLQVKGSAESLGLKTTASVVKSIFLVIVLDGLFAIFFASIGM
jgi:phospholipid/cholesterol/gamma-HCH transport system permease protein